MWHQSSLYVEGKAEGRLELARETCAAMVRRHHPALLERVMPAIHACDDPARLTEWTLAAPDLDHGEFVTLVSRP